MQIDILEFYSHLFDIQYSSYRWKWQWIWKQMLYIFDENEKHPLKKILEKCCQFFQIFKKILEQKTTNMFGNHIYCKQLQQTSKKKQLVPLYSILLLGMSYIIKLRKNNNKTSQISNIKPLQQDNYDNTNILQENQSVQISKTLDNMDSSLDTIEKLNLQIIKKFPIEPLDLDSKNCLEKITYNQRGVEEKYKFYIRDQINQAEFLNYYTIQSPKIKKELKKYCISMIPVRGDGNCFYTSFGYQFLKFVINDQNLYQEIKQKYSNIEFKIEKKQEWLITNQQKLLDRFFKILDILVNLKQVNLKNEFLFKLTAAHIEDEYNCDGFFNALTVIFLRNLAFKLVMESDELRDVVFDKENLLIWEKECNNNEPIIKLLAENLKVHVNLLFFDNRNFKLMQYGKESDKLVILLMKPGHYNIGIAPQ